MIDKQEAINVLERYKRDVEHILGEESELVKAIETCEMLIAELPDIHMKQRWISCDERLPESEEEVWVTIQGHDVITCNPGETIEEAIARIQKVRYVTRGYWCEEERGWNDPSFGCPLVVQPIAWMPITIPKAYEGERQW